MSLAAGFHYRNGADKVTTVDLSAAGMKAALGSVEEGTRQGLVWYCQVDAVEVGRLPRSSGSTAFSQAYETCCQEPNARARNIR